MKKILIIGATSAIANETAKLFAKDGAELFLVGRSGDKLQAIEADLKVRGAVSVASHKLDFTQLTGYEEMIDAAINMLGGMDAVLIAHGTLPDQKECEQSPEKMLEEYTVNCTSFLKLLTLLGNYFEKQGKGTIAVITSVAGDRGRQSNYVYGSAKGAVSLFLQGLRNRLASKGVNVLTIKPGFVDTPMTADVPKNPLFASAQKVAKGIYSAMKSGKDVVYLPGFWKIIMGIIKSVPERIFKGLKL